MIRNKIRAAAVSAIFSALMLPVASAQDASDPFALDMQSSPVTNAYGESPAVPAIRPSPASQRSVVGYAPEDLSTRQAVRSYAESPYGALSAMPVSGTGTRASIPRLVQQQSVVQQPFVANPLPPNTPQSIDPSIYMTAPQTVPQQPGYVRLGAPLYPSPRPNIPIWTGGSMITSPALAPHEMLYPHTYRAIYPPYYHRVRGSWILTPFGIRSHERWELQGTQVEVSYRSRPPLLTNMTWHPPVSMSSGIGNRY